MRPGSYSVTAPAKVNLGLAVLTRRGDGFHEIETLMATLDLADELQLRVAPAPDGTADAGEKWTITQRVDSGELPGASRGAVTAGPDNLAYRAADAYLRARGRRVAVEIDLIKRVPAAAGEVLRVMDPPEWGASFARTAGFVMLLPAMRARR